MKRFIAAILLITFFLSATTLNAFANDNSVVTISGQTENITFGNLHLNIPPHNQDYHYTRSKEDNTYHYARYVFDVDTEESYFSIGLDITLNALTVVEQSTGLSPVNGAEAFLRQIQEEEYSDYEQHDLNFVYKQSGDYHILRASTGPMQSSNVSKAVIFVLDKDYLYWMDFQTEAGHVPLVNAYVDTILSEVLDTNELITASFHTLATTTGSVLNTVYDEIFDLGSGHSFYYNLVNAIIEDHSTDTFSLFGIEVNFDALVHSSYKVLDRQDWTSLRKELLEKIILEYISMEKGNLEFYYGVMLSNEAQIFDEFANIYFDNVHGQAASSAWSVACSLRKAVWEFNQINNTTKAEKRVFSYLAADALSTWMMLDEIEELLGGEYTEICQELKTKVYQAANNDFSLIMQEDQNKREQAWKSLDSSIQSALGELALDVVEESLSVYVTAAENVMERIGKEVITGSADLARKYAIAKATVEAIGGINIGLDVLSSIKIGYLVTPAAGKLIDSQQAMIALVPLETSLRTQLAQIKADDVDQSDAMYALTKLLLSARRVGLRLAKESVGGDFKFDLSTLAIIQPQMSTDAKATVLNEVNAEFEQIDKLLEQIVYYYHTPITLTMASRNHVATAAWCYDIKSYFPAGGNLIVVSLTNDKCGIIDSTGKIIIEPQWDSIHHIENTDLFKVSQDGKYGLIDRTGNIIAKLQWDDIITDEKYVNSCNDAFVVVVDDFYSYYGQRYGFIDAAGNIISEPQWDGAGAFSEGLALVRSGDDFGFIDKNGRVVVQPVWDGVGWFSNGVAIVYQKVSSGQMKFLHGLVNTSGELITQATWDSISVYQDIAVVEKDDRYGILDLNSGDLIRNQHWDQVYPFCDGLARVRKDGQYGYIDSTGKIVIEVKYSDACDFSEGLALVTTAGQQHYSFIDKTGNVVFETQWNAISDFSEGLTQIYNEEGYYGFIDTTGKIVYEPQWSYAPTKFKNGLAIIVEDDYYGLIDSTGKVVCEPQWDYIGDFTDEWTAQHWVGLVKVLKGDYWGWIDSNGQIVSEPQWDISNDFDGELASVWKGEEQGIINTKGEIVIGFGIIPEMHDDTVSFIEESLLDNIESIYSDANADSISDTSSQYSSRIAVGLRFMAGLKSDGSVVVTGGGADEVRGVDGWSDIVAIAAGDRFIVGLKSDGTVVGTGKREKDWDAVNNWQDIVAIAASGTFVMGLKSDGTVVMTDESGDVPFDKNDWTNIVAVTAGRGVAYGLKADGTVVAKGNNRMGQCDVNHWTDIKAIVAHSKFTIGVKSNGTFEVTEYYHQTGTFDISELADITAAAAQLDIIGLKPDGTVVVTWERKAYGEEKFYNVDEWTDIVAVAAGRKHLCGLRSDGTVFVTCEEDYCEFNVSDWDLWD